MQHGISGIDHPVIGVRDMEAARSAYERIGFTIPPRGVHPAWGTGNWCIMFENDYLELRGIVEPEKGGAKMNPFLNQYGEGLMGVAFSSSNAQDCHDDLVRSGLHPHPVRNLQRTFELPSGHVQPSFSLCFLREEEAPGFMSTVVCQHLTPNLLRKPEWLPHENGAVAVISMIGLVDDLDAATEAHTKLFGDESVEREGDTLTIRFDTGQMIHLTNRSGLPSAFPELAPFATTSLDRLLAVQLRCRDRQSAAALFAARGFECLETPQGVLLEPQAACGVVFEFAE